jgi:hypothetical protein
MKTTLLALVALLCLTFVASAADISGKWVVDASAAPAGGPGGGPGGAGPGGGAPGGPGGPGGGGRMGGGMGGGTYEFKVAGSKLTGTVTQQGRGGGDPTVTQISDGKVSGDTFSFSITRTFGDNEMKIDYTGKIVGDKLELTSEIGRGPRTMTLKKAE